MNYKKLRDYLIGKHKECIRIGDYWLPEKIEAPRFPGRILDLKVYRERNLSQPSEYESEFRRVFEGIKEEKYIPEFPIPIFNREEWLRICERKNIRDDSILNKSLISIDFFFPYRAIAIEIDGCQHWKNEVQIRDDEVRDEYLSSLYSLPVHRFPQFTRDSVWRLREIGPKHPILSSPFSFKNWNDGIVENWKKVYYHDILGFEYISKQPKNKFGMIRVTKFQLNNIFKQGLSDSDRKRIKFLLKELYDIELEIP